MDHILASQCISLRQPLAAVGSAVSQLFGSIFGRQAPEPNKYRDVAIQTEVAEVKRNTETRDTHSSTSSSATTASSGSSTSSTASDSATTREVKKAFDDIPNDLFKDLLLRKLGHNEQLSRDDCYFLCKKEGAYHHCRIFYLKGHGDFVVKVPFTGTKELWQEGHAHNLRSEVLTMHYIRRHTRVPVPQVFAYDDTLWNSISAPYILMRKCEGMKAISVWVDWNNDGKPNRAVSDYPSPESEKRREHFLKSLANTMAELRKLKFDKIGMLNFHSDFPDSPQVGHHFAENGTEAMKRIDPFESTKAYLWDKLNGFRDLVELDEDGKMSDGLTGIWNFHQAVYNSHTFPSSVDDGDEHETFVLTHNDLDFQNIFVGEQGTITGIIDWDGTMALPRCVGYAALPKFLREDWMPGYKYKNAYNSPWGMQKYAKQYTKFMKEATSSATTVDGAVTLGDGKYTSKSGMYIAAYQSIGPNIKKMRLFLERMFQVMPELWTFDQEDFFDELGRGDGWYSADNMLDFNLPGHFAPDKE